MRKNTSNNKSKSEEMADKSKFLIVKELRPRVIPSRDDVQMIYNQLISTRRFPGSDLDVYTTLVPYEAGISSDASGNVQNVWSNDPNNSAYWSTIYGNWEQYRVLGVAFRFIPNSIHGGATTIYKSPLIYVTDFDSSANLTSYGLARTFSNSRERESTESVFILAVEDDSTQAVWNDVNTSPPGNSLWVKQYGSGFTASTPIGRVTVDYIVQFKNRGV